MKSVYRLCVCLIALMCAPVAVAESSYDIAEFYEVVEPASGTKAVGRHDKAIEVEYILSPTRVDEGKYVVEVKKIGDNLYQIKGTDICLETRYCYKYVSWNEKVVVIIKSNYGYTKGKIIFD